MSISTYAELKAAVASWLNRESITANVADFIRLAEAQMNREIKHWRGEVRDDLTISARYTDLPADFRTPIRLSVPTANGPRELEPVSQSEIVDLRYGSNDTAGVPQYYALSGGKIEVFPTPDETYTAQFIYRANLPALSDSNTTNWLLTEAPDAYLYGTLMQSAPWLREDERVAMWSSMYAQAMQSVNKDGEMAKFGGAGLRMKIRAY
jgi:hypothetical protein